jgi:hypothetical protein
LAIVGDCRRLLAIVGDCWRLLAIVGDIFSQIKKLLFNQRTQ